MGQEYDILVPVYQAGTLGSWRDSTEFARRLGHPLLPVLTAIETTLLAHDQPIPKQAESMARAEGWDVDALLKWKAYRSTQLDYLPSLGSMSLDPITKAPENSRWFRLPLASFLVLGVYVILVLGLIMLTDQNAITITYRTMVYAMMFAPFGAILRWRLSDWNGKCTVPGWEWLPLGTLVVNVVGCIVSAFAVASEYRHLELVNNEVEKFWIVGTLRAVKVGFAGCLTTVSSFAAEVSGFMQSGSDHAYPYILTTLGTSCLLGCIVYGSIVFLEPW
jgi:fluoride ion exporter CrcB/FEX